MEGARLEPADEIALAGGLDLEAAERLGGADQLVGGRVRRALTDGAVEIDALAGGAFDLGERVRHGGLHPHAQHIELEQPQVLHVVLVELRHGEPLAAGGDDGGAGAQRTVGEQHTAGVHGDAARQRVQRLHQFPQPRVVLLGGDAAQFGQLGEGGPGVAGADVRERLGEAVDLRRVHAQRQAGVADGVPHPVGLGHGDGRHPFLAEAVEDGAVGVQAAGGFDVHVDVGQDGAARGEEALHEQAVFDRVGQGDAQEVVDQGAGARAAGGDADAEIADVVDDLGDGEEVGGEAEPADDGQLRVEAFPALPVPVVAAGDHAGGAAGAQDAVGGPGVGTDEVRLGEVDAADAQVVLGVDAAGGGGVGGVPQEAVGGVLAQAGGLGDAEGGVGHGAGVLEPVFAVVAPGAARVDGDQAAGGVQDVGDRSLAGVGVPDGVGEHRDDALLGGEPQRAGGVPYGARGAGFEPERGPEPFPPGGEQPGGAVGAAGGEGAGDVGVGAEQHEQAVGVRGVRHVVPLQEGPLPVPGVGGADQPAQPGPAGGAVPGEEEGAGRGFVGEGAAPYRGTAAGGGRGGVRRARVNGEVHPVQRPYPGRAARLGEADGAGEGVPVGEGEGVHAALGGAFGEPFGVGGPVPGGEPGRDAQLCEAAADRRRHPAPPACPSGPP